MRRLVPAAVSAPQGSGRRSGFEGGFTKPSVTTFLSASLEMPGVAGPRVAITFKVDQSESRVPELLSILDAHSSDSA